MGGSVHLSGVAASEGVAVGPAYVYAPRGPEPGAERIPEEAVEEEVSRFRRAVEAVRERLLKTAAGLREAGSGEEAAIFEAHAELAGDPELAAEVEQRVREEGESAASAVLAVGEEYAEAFVAMDDEYMAARADDVRDVSAQIAAELVGGSSSGLEGLERPSVILARNLLPSDTARLPREKVLGFVTAEGSRTSHVAIMARSFGIPAVVGVGDRLEEAFGASVVAVDGTGGYAVADPDPETLEEFERRRKRAASEAALLEEYRHVEARTRGGIRIEVSANLGSPEEAEEALAWGAEGVGLFRTEFLFMEREELPSEEEQYAAYRRVAEIFGERPVIVRTLDVGGDKDLPGIDRPAEENPFLGWRGIRMSLDLPDLFRTQLRAVLRAAAHGNLKVMFPMVTGVEEIRAAKAHLEECRRELEEGGTLCGPLEIGVMVETPAAAILSAELAREVSFFSIGTNDLIQYTLAADRGNERLRRLYRADHPAVLELIRHTCEAAREAGIWVGACGEAAGDPDMIPHLIRLGVTELSMSPPSIPRAKRVISRL
ncbi:Phosphoenolpyruvate-protein phosphotransferase [Rubrobacter xylanophilus DSM 9941]|uniref:phosphoenolpyruvate--protein phosphotransferase n=1 Tax=Rubrobacter xylanophilus TaxID=49319 RepID=UPI001C63C974|nr:phosphoenolpyruvate--protein phosphotransferase [Rubrobacter xylanophilus]QYJ15009.1 Phosphoenolpyruvate-protein phosphotransferase [Rubrobacter xylanophilus DSM 9941]